jgi:hypothetical protein
MSDPNTTTKKPVEELSFSAVMDKAAKSAIRGGTAGAVAMGANVACLMWMRTTVRKEKKQRLKLWRVEGSGLLCPPIAYYIYLFQMTHIYSLLPSYHDICLLFVPLVMPTFYSCACNFRSTINTVMECPFPLL